MSARAFIFLVYTRDPICSSFEKLSIFALNIYKYKGSLLTEKYLTEELCNYQFWRKICEKTLEILIMRRHIPLSYFSIYSEYVHLFNYSSFVSQWLEFLLTPGPCISMRYTRDLNTSKPVYEMANQRMYVC